MSVSLLAQAKAGVQLGPQIYIFYGPEKKGKSSFAAQYPQTIFLDIEGGTGQLNVTRLTPDQITDYPTLMKVIGDLTTEKAQNFKTVVVDSITALEKMMAKEICRKGNKESLDDFGFGGGYQRLEEMAAEFNVKVRGLKAAGYNVILVGHTRVKAFNDPMAASNYDRYRINCDERLAGQLKSAADNIFFINSAVALVEDKNKKSKAISDGQSVLYTQWHAAFDAGNRLNLPSPMDLSYSAIKKAIAEYKPLPEKLKTEIDMLISRREASTVSAAKKAAEDAGNDIIQLERIKAKLLTIAEVTHA